MEDSNVLLNIELSDELSLKSFSLVLVKIIKYIAYNSRQIPYSYEGFTHLVKHRRNKLQLIQDKKDKCSFNQKIADSFFVKVSTAHDNYEATFNYLEEELNNPAGIKQIVLLVGETFIFPKCIYRIQKPHLVSCEKNINSKKLLHCILKSMLNSKQLTKLFDNSKTPSNIFVLIEMNEDQKPQSNWFLPMDNYSLPSVKNEVNIRLQPPSFDKFQVYVDDYDSPCEKKHIPNGNEENSRWFKSKESLQGFKDIKVDGMSVVNYLLTS